MTTLDPTVENLESAFRRAVGRKIYTAAEAIAHLRATGWTDLWEAYRACEGGNWYSFRDALRGKPGHQKMLKAILTLQPRR